MEHSIPPEVTSRSKDLIAYIDESGDEGFQFPIPPARGGSSYWFVLAAVLVSARQDREVAQSINRVKNRLWPEQHEQWRKPLHWYKLKHAQKKVAVSELIHKPFSIIAVAIDKAHEKLDRDRFDPRRLEKTSPHVKHGLYFYAARFLTERICKGLAPGERVDLVFEHRAQFSAEEFRKYVSLVSILPGPNGSPTIPTGVIGDVRSEGKQVSKMLQVADICAGALADALENDKYGNVEDSYVLALGSKFRRVDKKLWGYGIKLFPGTEEEKVARFPGYAWMEKI